MPWYNYPLLVLAGMAAGFVNVLAGNGSLITLPALLFIGLPANIANATNRVGVTLQNVVGSAAFHQQGKLDLHGALLYSMPAMVGSVLGALLASRMGNDIFRRVLPIAMVTMLVLMFIDPKKWLEGQAKPSGQYLTPLRFLLFFAIGVYGGFLQAGVGIFLLVALVLGGGYNVIRGNAVKVFLVLSLTFVAMVVFWASAQIQWVPGLVLGIGNMIGAWLAARYASEWGTVWVRRFVILVVLASIAQLMGAFDLVGGLL